LLLKYELLYSVANREQICIHTTSLIPPLYIEVPVPSQEIRVITKLPNSEQSYQGKVKTHKYINRQNQSTTENCENRNDPDLVQAFLKKWWDESDFKAPNLQLSLFVSLEYKRCLFLRFSIGFWNCLFLRTL
jgi:hypothetical protein